ncbi:hypothetical protein EK904_014815 [Melospiza melodia maxima]|nr:hypothetical protein EK904_014815 [Melospiza melodia maxima]
MHKNQPEHSRICSSLGLPRVPTWRAPKHFSPTVNFEAASGRKKALTTCSSHLITLSIAYGSCIALYTRPAEVVSLSTNKSVALLNTVLYPFLNPFIYSLRNKPVILALSKSIARARTKLFP